MAEEGVLVHLRSGALKTPLSRVTCAVQLGTSSDNRAATCGREQTSFTGNSRMLPLLQAHFGHRGPETLTDCQHHSISEVYPDQ